MHNLSDLIRYSTCFGQVHCPSSGVSQNYIHAIGICHAGSVGCLQQTAKPAFFQFVDPLFTFRFSGIIQRYVVETALLSN